MIRSRVEKVWCRPYLETLDASIESGSSSTMTSNLACSAGRRDEQQEAGAAEEDSFVDFVVVASTG